MEGTLVKWLASVSKNTRGNIGINISLGRIPIVNIGISIGICTILSIIRELIYYSPDDHHHIILTWSFDCTATIVG